MPECDEIPVIIRIAGLLGLLGVVTLPEPVQLAVKLILCVFVCMHLSEFCAALSRVCVSAYMVYEKDTEKQKTQGSREKPAGSSL